MEPLNNTNRQALFRKAYWLAMKLNKGKSYTIPVPDAGNPELSLEKLLYDGRRANLGNCLIDAASGSIEKQYMDLSLPCLAGKLEIRRSYCDDPGRPAGLQASETSGVGLLGRGWALEYEDYCTRSDNELAWMRMNGACERFIKLKEGWVNLDNQSLTALSGDDPKHEEFTIRKENLFYVYGYDGRLKKIFNRNRNAIEMYYMGDTCLIQGIRSSCGKSLSFQYKDDKIIQITDNIGRSVKYFYDGDYLIQAERPNGGKYKFSYDKMHKKMKRAEDSNGNVEFQMEFDRHGRPIHLYKNSRQNWQIIRDEKSKSLNFQSEEQSLMFLYDREGLITEIRHGSAGFRYEYDSKRHVAARTDLNGGQSSFQYDEYGRLIKTTCPDGTWKRWEYGNNEQIAKLIDSNAYEKIFEYDRHGNLVTAKEKIDKGITAVTRYERDAKGRVVMKTNPNKNAVRYIYKTDDSILPESIVYPNGFHLERQYDGAARLIWEKDMCGETRYLYNNLDLVIETFYSNGSHDFKRYDLMGRLMDVITPREARRSDIEKRAPAKFRYMYDEECRFLYLITPSGHQIEPCQGKKRQEAEGNCRYDYTGKVVEKRLPERKGKKGETLCRTIHYTYDKNSNLTQEKIVESEESEGASSHVIKTYEYDDRNNMSHFHTNSGEDRKYFYKGVSYLARETIRINDDKKHRILYEYNEMGLLAQKIELMDLDDADWDVLDVDVNSISTIRLKTSFSYNENGNLIGVTLPDESALVLDYDESGNRIITPENIFLSESEPEKQDIENETVETRDKFGRVIKMAWPDGRHEVYEYDYANNLSCRTDEKGRVTRYVYNSVNWLKRIIEPSGKVKEFLYGPDGHVTKESEADL